MRRTQRKEVDRAYVGESMEGGYAGRVDVIWHRTYLEDCCVLNTMRTRGSEAKGSLSICAINRGCKIISPIERARIQGGQMQDFIPR